MLDLKAGEADIAIRYARKPPLDNMCANAAGSGSNPDGLGQPYPEKPAGMLPSRYAWLMDRLDAAEDDLGLPLTLGGPRFAYRPDRHRLRGRP